MAVQREVASASHLGYSQSRQDLRASSFSLGEFALPRVRDFEGPATLPQDFHHAQHPVLAGMMIKARMDLAYGSGQQRRSDHRKVFDYIKARRPILCFSPENTEAARLVKQWQIGEWLNSQAPERALQALSTLRLRDYPALLDDELVSSFARNGQYKKLYERLPRVA